MLEPIYYKTPPDKKYYFNRTKDIIIYTFYQSLENCNYCDEICNGTCEKYLEDNNLESPDPENIKIDNLKNLLDLIPEGLTSNDIKFRIDISSGDMAYYGHSVSFYYKEKLPDLKEEYDKALATYNKEYTKYKKEHDKFLLWKKEKDITELEIKLAELKK
jgi:hypothetical protein